MVLRRRAPVRRSEGRMHRKSRHKSEERGKEDKSIGVAMKLQLKRPQADDKNNGRWRPVDPRSLERAYAESLSTNSLPKDNSLEEDLTIQI